MNPTLYWTLSHSILIKLTTHKANLSGKIRNTSRIRYRCRLFSVKMFEMWILRPEPQYFLTSPLFRNGIGFVLVTAMLLRCTGFKNTFHGSYTQSTFWCSQQVHGLMLREAVCCSLGSLVSTVNGRGYKPGFLDFSLWKRKSSSSLWPSLSSIYKKRKI